eukprot:jgi/Botrbrau1/4121/Bobra.152_3s0067.1
MTGSPVGFPVILLHSLIGWTVLPTAEWPVLTPRTDQNEDKTRPRSPLAQQCTDWWRSSPRGEEAEIRQAQGPPPNLWFQGRAGASTTAHRPPRSRNPAPHSYGPGRPPFPPLRINPPPPGYRPATPPSQEAGGALTSDAAQLQSAVQEASLTEERPEEAGRGQPPLARRNDWFPSGVPSHIAAAQPDRPPLSRNPAPHSYGPGRPPFPPLRINPPPPGYRPATPPSQEAGDALTSDAAQLQSAVQEASLTEERPEGSRARAAAVGSA